MVLQAKFTSGKHERRKVDFFNLMRYNYKDMKALYLAWNALSIMALAALTFFSARKKTRLSPIVAALCSIAALCLILYSAQFLTANKRLALFFSALYGICDLCILAVIYFFVISIAEISRPTKKTAAAIWIFLALAAADAISLVANIWTEGAVRLSPSFLSDGRFYCWKRTYGWPIYLDIALQLSMSAVVIAALLKRTFRLPDFYKSKFITISAFFFAIVALGGACHFLSFDFDLSLSLYVFMAAYAFQISFWGINASLLNTMFSLVSENISYAIVCFASKGKCFYLNREARNIFGFGPKGFASAEGYREKLRSQYPEKMFSFLTLTQNMQVNSATRTFDCEYKIIKDKKGRPMVSYLKLADTTEELKRLEEEKFRTERDPLTGLYNRSAFFKKAAEMLRSDKSQNFVMAATDIMDFKIINNLFGEQVGDEILKLQAALISGASFPNSIYGRISADKFAALIPKKFCDVNMISQNNQALQQAVEKYNYKLQNYTGIYEISDKFENPRLMYDKAAMTIENIRGDLETMTAFYNSSIMDKQIHDKKIVSEFEGALANKEFAMFLQPQINALDGKILGGEALVRWISPEKGVIPPFEFIPVLEKSGLIHKLDQYMWEEAAKKLAEWKAAGNEMYISINISAKDFYYCDVYAFLTGLVEKYKIEPQKLNIEITETVLMQDINAHRQVLKKLNDYGFSIEMDDFGAGYSSLNTLKNLEMNTLKIDMGFLRAATFSQKIKDIISSIISMSKTLGMTVVTEGVETEDQVRFLKEANCDVFQGYYFSKPISVHEFEKNYCGGGA